MAWSRPAPSRLARSEERAAWLFLLPSFVLFAVFTAWPVLSALRNFSAPVVLTTNAEAKDGYVLLAADPDLFNRWEAGQNLARDLILKRAAGSPDEVSEERFSEALEMLFAGANIGKLVLAV